MPVTPKSRILTNTGIKEVKKLENTEDIAVLDFVDDSLKVRNSTKVIPTGKKYMWRVRTDKGTYLVGYNTDFLLEDKTLVHLNNLKVGDKLLSCLVDGKEEITVSVDPEKQESFYSMVIRDLVDGGYGVAVEQRRVQVVEHVGFCERFEAYSCVTNGNYLIIPSNSNEGIFIREDI